MSKPIKLSILWKGLIVLLIPFCLQAVFFVNLHELTARSEVLSKQEIQQADLVHFMDGLVADLLEMQRTAMNEGFSVRAANVPSSHELRDAFLKKIEVNRILWQGNPDREKAVDMAKAACLIETDSLPEQGTIQQRLVSMTYVYRWMRQSLRKMNPEFLAVKEADEKERADLRRRRDAAELNRRQIDSQLTNLAVLDAVLAISVLFWFLRDITNRMRLLVHNAQIIPTGQPITMAVGGGDEIGYLDGVIHSVSEQLRAAAEHRKFLIEMVAHDLRSPLLSAKLTMDRLARNMSNMQPSDNQALEGARSGMGRVISLVEDLLTIEKLEAGKLDLDIDLVDPHQVIEDAFEILHAMAQAKNVELKNSVLSKPIEADPARLSQVIENLVGNAIKFAPELTTVEVSNVFSPASVKFAVHDQGAGIPTDQQAVLFQKFSQIANGKREGGFGLGLAISKLIVSAHGGTIGVENEPPNGCSFWFTLPVSVDLTE